MAAFAGDFDDLPEDESSAPPLPPEDRLWRHPSELGNANPGLSLDPVAVRRRWLQTETTRGSAWTAGLVGALLATGLVAIGTHLATALTGRGGTATTSASAIGASTPPAPAERGIAPSLASMVSRVGAAVAVLDVTHGSTDERCLGLVVRPDGMLLAPAAQLTGASTLLVTLPDGVPYVGRVVGTDAPSGLAVVHINGATNLASATLATAAPAEGSIALAVGSPGGKTYTATRVRALDTAARVGAQPLVDAMTVDLAAAQTELGSALVDGRGHVVGILTAAGATTGVATPSWLAKAVADQIIAHGAVSHGWLGIVGTTRTAGHSGGASGALVSAVAPSASAAEAGVRPGDVIVALDGAAIGSMPALQGRLYALAPRTPITLEVDRGGALLTLHAVLDDHPGR